MSETIARTQPVPLEAGEQDAGQDAGSVELSVVLPCLNEAETVATCVQKAMSFFLLHGVSGEVVVADNGSTDGSQALAAAAGATVVSVAQRGYGSALMGGILAARGRYVIMGDADDSYDLADLGPFLDRLRVGADLVMGNRFRGGISRGAMPALHKYLGNPVLSFIGRLFFGSKIGDFHCGLRGFNRESVLQLGLQATGMEFASEIVVKATLAGQRIEEVPTTLSPDGRSRPPHLRSWRDGWRHLRFLLLFSPRWLFFYPGLVMLCVGLIVGAAIIPGPLDIGGVKLDVDTLAAASALMTIGLQAILFAIFTTVYASNEGFLPPSAAVSRLRRIWTLERGLAVGAVLGLAGIAGGIASLDFWYGFTFGRLPYDTVLRLVIPSTTALVISSQIIFGTFFLSILDVRRSDRRLGVAATDEQGAPAYVPPALAPRPRQGEVLMARTSEAPRADELAGSVRDRRRGRHRNR
ncbi:MAG TPA: glycosyltransferase family 2 protein [Streptosporangiaceae bacterium]|nr:glycosyltransferase family 2 protein [Streptosporangiaceae bacterium]